MRIRFYLMSLALLSAQAFNVQADGDLFSMVRQPGFVEKLTNAQVGTERLKAAGFLLGGAVLFGGAKHFHKSPIVKKAMETIGLDPHDAANVIGVSCTTAALSFIAGPETREGLLRFAKRAPVAGISFAGVCSGPFQSLISNTPLVGQYLVCPTLAKNDDSHYEKNDKECEGICRKCIMTKGITGIALYLAVDQGINAYWNN